MNLEDRFATLKKYSMFDLENQNEDFKASLKFITSNWRSTDVLMTFYIDPETNEELHAVDAAKRHLSRGN